MDKQEFIGTENDTGVNRVISEYYDILDTNEERISLSEALAATKQELIEANEKIKELTKQAQKSEDYKNRWVKSLNEINLYKNLCKAQSDLINLK